MAGALRSLRHFRIRTIRDKATYRYRDDGMMVHGPPGTGDHATPHSQNAAHYAVRNWALREKLRTRVESVSVLPLLGSVGCAFDG
jgi:hypothetical protein